MHTDLEINGTAVRPVRVFGTGAYLPERVVDNAELARRFGCSEEWILERTGIRERRYVEPGTATSDLAVKACRRALEAAGTDAGDIGLVLCATYSPDYPFPATACIVQDRLEAKGAGAIDLEAACSGFLAAFLMGAQCVASGFVEKVLVVGADINSTLLDEGDRNASVLFGDGAGAAVLGPASNGNGLLSGVMGADGSGWHHFVRPAGGSRCTPSHKTVAERQHSIRMQGQPLFKFGVKALVSTSKDVLERAGVGIDEVDLLVPHQANLRIIDAGSKRLGIDGDRVFTNIERCGNTSAASVGIALDEAVRGGRLHDGANLLMVGFGAGLTWAGALMRW